MELQNSIRLAHQNHKIVEQRWDKERIEHKHNQQVLENMMKDRSHFETRVKSSLSELLEEKEKKYKQYMKNKELEVEQAKKASIEDREAMEIMAQNTKQYKQSWSRWKL